MAVLNRGRRRRLAMGLATVLGLRPLGFFLPHRYAASVRPGSYPRLEPLFLAAKPEFDDLLQAIDALMPAILALPGPGASPRFDQAWFPALDGLAAYAVVRRHRPRRIIEVGSGHSTRFLAAAVRDGGFGTAIACIDPAPRASLDGLDVAWRPAVVQAVPVAEFAALEPGDLLFIDSSHLLMPGSDVDHLIGQVLPVLRAGVVLHIHDIFLPDPYPPSWDWRGYNEQSAIAALLQGGGYELLFASHFVATRMAGRLDAGPLGNLTRAGAELASSLWLRKR